MTVFARRLKCLIDGLFQGLVDHRLLLLHGTTQGVLMLTRIRGNQGDLGFCEIKGINPASAFALEMDLHHDSLGIFLAFMKKLAQDTDHIVHRRIVIIEQTDPIQMRFTHLRLPFENGLLGTFPR